MVLSWERRRRKGGEREVGVEGAETAPLSISVKRSGGGVLSSLARRRSRSSAGADLRGS